MILNDDDESLTHAANRLNNPTAELEYLMPDEDPGEITWPCNGRDVLVKDTGMEEGQKTRLFKALEKAGAVLVVLIDAATDETICKRFHLE